MHIPMYPNTPSVGQTDTSRLAAEAIAPNVQTLREKALALIAERPSTADEVAEAMNESILAVRPRISELKTMGKVMATDLRRKNRFNRSQIVWALVPAQSKLF
jgi:hypothetical protein